MSATQPPAGKNVAHMPQAWLMLYPMPAKIARIQRFYHHVQPGKKIQSAKRLEAMENIWFKHALVSYQRL